MEYCQKGLVDATSPKFFHVQEYLSLVSVSLNLTTTFFDFTLTLPQNMTDDTPVTNSESCCGQLGSQPCRSPCRQSAESFSPWSLESLPEAVSPATAVLGTQHELSIYEFRSAVSSRAPESGCHSELKAQLHHHGEAQTLNFSLLVGKVEMATEFLTQCSPMD